METGKVYIGDCLDLFKYLEDGSVDLIITSPPYNLGEEHHTGKKRFKSYNAYSDNLPEKEYQAWQIQVLKECYRVLKPSGSMFYNHKNRIKNGEQITPYEWLFKTDFVIKQELVWFNRSQNFDKIRFYPMTERVYWLTKSNKTVLNNVIGHHDIFDWSAEGTDKEHKRAFPVSMVEDLLKCFDKGLVLDPFAGSGTVGIACYNLLFDFIGFELDEEYANLANKRLSNRESQLDIFHI
jgi:modification methylase